MSDVRDGEGRNGSGAEETTERARKPVVLSFGTREPEVREQLPNLRLPRDSNQVALTFDDGPDQWTDPILDLLEAYDVPATFFVIGNKLDGSQVQRAVDLGCEVANHTFSHANLSELSNKEICGELADCSAAIFTATGQTPYFYRAPFLKDPPSAKMAGLALGMLSVDADVIAEDWKRDDWREITTRVAYGVKAGGRCVLMHDGVPSDRLGSRKATVKAVGALLPWFLDKGYELVTVSQFFGRVNAEAVR